MGEDAIQTGDRERDEERRTVGVTVLGRRGESALVEWNGRRGYVPAGTIEDGAVDERVLSAAIPYGMAWEEFVDLSHVTAQAVGDALRKANIWTVEDLERNVTQARKAVNKLMGTTLGALRRAAQQLEEV